MDYPKTVEAVYIGHCTLEGGKPGAVLQEITADGLGRELLFERKVLKGSAIGGVYAIEQTSDISFRVQSRRFVRRYEDTAQVAAWQIAVKSVELREEAHKAEKNAKIPAALELLEPLRAEYKKALPDRKRVIEVILLSYLRS